MSFATLGLAEPILRALGEENYTEATPIQAAAIPPVLAGRDVIGIAQTGTGKTAAYALPILNRLAGGEWAGRTRCRVLVLAPTRELAGQIADSFRAYGRHVGVSVSMVIGGVPIAKQVRSVQPGMDILVATPGRLLDLVKSRALNLDKVEVLVLDEADRMLDMGFIHDIRKISRLLPKERQTLLFSATMPAEIARLIGEMLADPVTVSVAAPATTVVRVAQRVIHVSTRGKKIELIARLLGDKAIDRALVFARTKHGADRIVRDLANAGIESDALHGNKSQGQRQRALKDFRSGSVRTLVATDIAARGIDVDGVSHVINYDVPNEAEAYVHRIGRTARAGNSGIAISLCAPDEVAFIRAIEKLIRQAIPAEYEDVMAGSREAGTRDGDSPAVRAARGARPHRQKYNEHRRDDRRPATPRPESRGRDARPPRADLRPASEESVERHPRVEARAPVEAPAEHRRPRTEASPAERRGDDRPAPAPRGRWRDENRVHQARPGESRRDRDHHPAGVSGADRAERDHRPARTSRPDGDHRPARSADDARQQRDHRPARAFGDARPQGEHRPARTPGARLHTQARGEKRRDDTGNRNRAPDKTSSGTWRGKNHSRDDRPAQGRSDGDRPARRPDGNRPHKAPGGNQAGAGENRGRQPRGRDDRPAGKKRPFRPMHPRPASV